MKNICQLNKQKTQEIDNNTNHGNKNHHDDDDDDKETHNNNNNINREKDNEKFSVAIFSHGLYGWRQINHSTCENLASHGYIVFACDHSPDGTLTRPFVRDDDNDDSSSSYTSFDYFCDMKQFSIEERTFYRNGMNRRVYDLRYLIDYIKSDKFYQLYPELKHRLNHQIIHLWGHSYGGGTITSLCCRKRDSKYEYDDYYKGETEKNNCHRDDKITTGQGRVRSDDGITSPNDNTLQLSSSSSSSLLSSQSLLSSSSYQIKAVALDGWLYPLCEHDFLNGLQPNTTLLNLSAKLWPYGKVNLR